MKDSYKRDGLNLHNVDSVLLVVQLKPTASGYDPENSLCSDGIVFMSIVDYSTYKPTTSAFSNMNKGILYIENSQECLCL